MTDYYRNWFGTNKFKKMLGIIDSSKFNYRNKIGKFKYIDIKDLVDAIRNNTISKIYAKKGLNSLNEIKNAETIIYKRRTPGQKELLNLFNDLLDTTLSDKTLKSKSQEDRNENENKNGKTLMSSSDDEDDDVDDDDDDDVVDDEDDDEIIMSSDEDDETINQNKKYIIVKNLNDCLDEIIDKSKSFEEQIKSLKKLENLEEYWRSDDYGDKELKFKYFKLKLAHMSNETDKKLFE